MKFAELIWQEQPIGSGELVKRCQQKFAWKKSTTYTFLKKLCEQGVFKNENAIVESLVSREDYLQKQGEQFVEKAFEGSLPKMIAAFMEHKRLSKAQIAEVIMLVLIARLAIRKAPRWCSYLLWGIVFLRLVCPTFPITGFSLIPTQMENRALAVWMEEESVGTGEVAVVSSQEQLLQNQELPRQLYEEQVSHAQSIPNQELSQLAVANNFVSYFWLAIALILGSYHTVSYWRLKAKVESAVETEPGVREIRGEHLSFVMGIFKPVIYLSEGLDEESRKVILCHERVHLQRRDYLWKPAALAICCVHWFNPLVWLAFYLMNKDCEMSCDEKVVSLLGEESKKIYSYALLDEASGGESRSYRKSSVCALLSFGEDHVKKSNKACVAILSVSLRERSRQRTVRWRLL